MAKFEIRVNDRRDGKAFEAAVDPKDSDACTDLLRAQVRDRKLPVGSTELVVIELGRVVKRYRAT